VAWSTSTGCVAVMRGIGWPCGAGRPRSDYSHRNCDHLSCVPANSLWKSRFRHDILTNDKGRVSLLKCDAVCPPVAALPVTLGVVLTQETALQVFEPDDFDVDAGDGEQRPLARLEQVAEDARDFAAHAKAPNTLKAYRIDWADVLNWCALHRLECLPAEPHTIALYLTDLARTHNVSTQYRRLSGISQAHQAAGNVTPTTDAQVRLVFQGIRRTLGSAPDQKNAAITAEVRAMVETLSPTSLIGERDRALLLVGFAGAFRRSELVSLDVGDVVFGADGLIVQLRRSKTDQEGEGRKVGLPFGSNPLTCPVHALRAWLATAIASGPIFRRVDRHGNLGTQRLTDQSVALIVKRCARAAGLDWERYAGHSLRSGLATAAAMADVSERAIMAQTGHKSLPMVRRYIRDGSLFRRNAAAAVGL
jgi:integrase